VLELLRLGDKFRAVTPTRMNDASSRSHRCAHTTHTHARHTLTLLFGCSSAVYSC
jgi:hypothetical protein